MSVDWEYSDTAGKFVTYAFTCELGITDFWYGWYDSSYVNRECDLNIPNLYYLTRVAGASFRGLAALLDDSAGGNGNGQLDPGELSGIWFTLRNQAIHPVDSAYAMTARLVSGSADVQVLDSGRSFANAERAGSTDNRASQFHIRASDTIAPGACVPLRLELTFGDAGRTYSQTLDFVIPGWRQPVTASTTAHYPSGLTATPNPACDRVLFSARPALTTGRLDIFSPDGRKSVSRNISGIYSWDCSRARSGVYFCRLVADAGSVTAAVRVIH